MKSYVKNCLIVRRKDDVAKILFHMENTKRVHCALDGYAIIPIEDFHELNNFKSFQEKRKQSNKAYLE